MKDNIIYVVPVREGSKGLPHKNRTLIDYVYKCLYDRKESVYITTDDNVIRSRYLGLVRGIVKRPTDLAADETSTKDTLIHAIQDIKPPKGTIIVCVYATYPERTIEQIDRALKFFKENNAKSLLCSKEYKGVSPYLMMYPNGLKGKQLIKHNLHRRQDYPKVFEISHFISIMTVEELFNLNSNLYNKDTVFMNIGDVVDIDTPSDLNKFRLI